MTEETESGNVELSVESLEKKYKRIGYRAGLEDAKVRFGVACDTGEGWEEVLDWLDKRIKEARP
jgi:hypothetical protein